MVLIFGCLIVFVCAFVCGCVQLRFRKPPCCSALKHTQPWLCSTDYNQGRCYSLHPAAEKICDPPLTEVPALSEWVQPMNRCVHHLRSVQNAFLSLLTSNNKRLWKRGVGELHMTSILVAWDKIPLDGK